MHAWASATAGVALLFFVGRNGADDNRKLCTFEEGNDCSLWNFTSSFRVVSNVSVLRLSEGIDPNEQILNSEFRGKLVQTNCQDFSNLMPLLQTANWINSTSTTSCALSFDLIIPEPSRLEAVEVILQRRGFRDHLLWSIADTSSSSRWSNHRIVLGRLNEPFRILFESSCVANREFSSGPLLALDNLHFQDCFRRSMKNSICAEPDKFPCHPTGTCLDADVMCDFSADCPDRSDEQDILCDTLPVGARCDFEKGMCLWTLQQQPEDSLSIAGNNTWSRTSARAAAPSAGLVMDHTTKTPGGFLLLLDMAQAGKQGLTGVGQLRSPVFPRMPLPESSSRPAGSCKVTFYYISSGVWTEGSVALMVHQVSGIGAAARDTIWQLRHRTESRANSADWKRVTVPITDLRSRYFLRFVGVHGVSNGHFAVDDISLSRACFFRGLNSTTSIDDDREYDFQFEKQFSVTNCGKSGPVGPAEEECRSLSTARAVSVLGKEEDVVFGGMGIQQWTVSTTGVYNITATGATGGGVRSTADGNACGGATVSGSFRLQAGEVVRFAVGQRGLPACTEGTEDCGQGAGGGGATLVFKDSTKKLGQSELLLVAAGGSGHSSGTSRQTCSCMAHVPATLVEPLDAKYIVSLLSGESAKMEVQSVCLKTVVRDGGFGGGSPSCDYSSGAGGGTVSAGSSPSDQEKWSVVSFISATADSSAESSCPIKTGEPAVVTVAIWCDCDVACVLDRHTRDYYCPQRKSLDAQLVLNNSPERMAVHYALTAVLLVLSVAGVSVCLYMGTRKGSAKCVVRRRAQCLSSCETTFSESERTAIRSPGNGMTNHSSMEINQLYELNGVQRFDDLRKIPRNLIQLKHPLGEGAFGIVYQGTLKSNSEYLPVAVKTLPGCILAESEVDFAAEAVIVCKFHHPNVVQCFGVSFDASPKYIVLELLAGGDVRTFLRRCRSAVDHLTVTTLELLDIVVDIAKGCQYLEQHHFVHRDIAARNCLLTSLTSPRAAKIADFGMARDVVRSDYYRRHSSVLLPVRWMPPEALQEGLFSTKSDIWAFGIFLWEVLSVGCSPYAGLSNQEVIHFVTNGGRLGAPSHFCPPELYDLMRKCWTSVPADRIRFSDVIQTLLGLMGLSSVAAAKVPDEMDSPLLLVQTEATLNTTNHTESVGGTMVDGLPDRTDERENRAHDYHSGTQLLPSNAGQR